MMTTIDSASTPGEDWQSGMNLLTAGKADEAIEVLQRFVQNQPDSFEGHNYLGVALAQRDRFSEAITALQKAVQLNGQSAQASFNLGLAFEGAGQQQWAQQAFQDALQIDPAYAAATHALSRLEAQQKEADRLHKPHALNLLGGLTAGFVAAIICAILWDKLTYYTGWQIGYVAIGVGFAVGTAVVFGAGQKRGLSLQIIGALLSLFGILLGETLLAMDHVHDYIAANPSPNTTGASSIDIFLFSIALLPESFKSSPMSALFALFGLWCGWTTPAKTQEETFPEATASDAAPAPAFVGNAPVAAPPALSTPALAPAAVAATATDAPPVNASPHA